MSKSFVCSTASVPISKSSAASSYDSSSKSGKWNNDFYIASDPFLKEHLKITNIWQYEIAILENDKQGWAELGIGVLNLFGMFSGTSIDYPDHWFLIAETVPLNLMGIYLFISYFCLCLKKQEKIPEFVWSFNIYLLSPEEGEKEYNELNEEIKGYIKSLNSMFGNSKKNKTFREDLILFYGENLVKKMLEKLISLKKENRQFLDFLGEFKQDKEFTKQGYFLIEKGGNGKSIKCYSSIDAIKADERKNYNYNEPKEKHHYNMVNKNCTIQYVRKIAEKLSNSYNVVDNNCQDFVRNILLNLSLN
jgi:hypothetical protein